MSEFMAICIPDRNEVATGPLKAPLQGTLRQFCRFWLRTFRLINLSIPPDPISSISVPAFDLDLSPSSVHTVFAMAVNLGT
jgi:hypothetical protein